MDTTINIKGFGDLGCKNIFLGVLFLSLIFGLSGGLP